MSPHLQSAGMALHPPILYLGYAATTIPFALAIAALLAGRLDDDWLFTVRRWSLLSWLALTIGMMTGMWWAYVEQDWGGAWAWDAIRNASFLPWLTTTMLLYWMLRQERSGVLRKGIVILAASSFLLAVIAAFTTRGAIISSVNAFAQSDARSWVLSFVVLAVAAVAYLAATRLRSLRVSAHIERATTTEGAFPLNNLLLAGIALSIVSGTLLPMLSAARAAGKVTDRASVDPYVMVALGLGALVLAAIVRETWRAASDRRRTTGESTRTALLRLAASHGRDFGAFAVRVGVVILAIAFAGFAFKTESPISLGPGESATLSDPYGRQWTFASQGVSDFEELNRHVTAVPLRATHHGTPVGLLRSERRQYIDSRGNPTFDAFTKAGIHSASSQDTYVTLVSVADDRAELRIAFNPLVMWVWIGGIIIAIGGLVAMWPTSHGTDE